MADFVVVVYTLNIYALIPSTSDMNTTEQLLVHNLELKFYHLNIMSISKHGSTLLELVLLQIIFLELHFNYTVFPWMDG